MAKILVADDDAQITKGLSMIIHEAHPDFEVLEASNGLEAWELLRQTDVDAVLTDISMPVMSGLDLLENIRKAELNISVIIISGFDDYDFVHRTMLKGAIDYLLKPIQKESLLEALDKALEKKRGGAGNWERFQLAEAIYDYLETRSYQPREAIKEALRNHNIDENTQACVLCAKGANNNLSEIGSNLKAALYTGNSKYVIYRVRKDNLGVICFFCDADTIHMVAREVLHQHTNLKYTFSKEPCPAKELPAEIQRCKTELEKMWFDEATESSEGKPQGSIETQFKDLTSYIMKLDSSEAESCATHLLDSMADEGATREFVVKSLLSWHVGLLGEIHELVSIVGRFTFTDNDFTIQIPQSESFSVLKKNLCRILVAYITALSKGRDRRRTQIEESKAFILEHIQDNPTINEVAGITGLHPNYYSTIFKEYVGITYREYVRNAKIQEAIRLMQETNLKINEISEKVGYPDPAHFSRAFKQVTGVSPQQYGKEKK